MITRVCYLIGGPGSGKSTLMREITKQFGKVVVLDPIPHTILLSPKGPKEVEMYLPTAIGIELGRDRDTFSGTDALAMNIQPRALAWLDTRPYRNVIAEGDRLGNLSFFKSLIEFGLYLYVLWLDTPQEIAERRRVERVRRDGGTLQDPKWVTGRYTKAARLVEAIEKWDQAPSFHRLDGRQTPAELVSRLQEHEVIGEMLHGKIVI